MMIAWMAGAWLVGVACGVGALWEYQRWSERKAQRQIAVVQLVLAHIRKRIYKCIHCGKEFGIEGKETPLTRNLCDECLGNFQSRGEA